MCHSASMSWNAEGIVQHCEVGLFASATRGLSQYKDIVLPV